MSWRDRKATVALTRSDEQVAAQLEGHQLEFVCFGIERQVFVIEVAKANRKCQWPGPEGCDRKFRPGDKFIRHYLGLRGLDGPHQDLCGDCFRKLIELLQVDLVGLEELAVKYRRLQLES